MSTAKVQQATNKLIKWTKRWKIKLNELKSIHINFTNKRLRDPPTLEINGTKAPYENNAKYLGMNLDTKRRWKHHINKKRTEVDIRYQKYYWLLGRNSKLSIRKQNLDLQSNTQTSVALRMSIVGMCESFKHPNHPEVSK